jgi:hypothetical protein
LRRASNTQVAARASDTPSNVLRRPQVLPAGHAPEPFCRFALDGAATAPPAHRRGRRSRDRLRARGAGHPQRRNLDVASLHEDAPVRKSCLLATADAGAPARRVGRDRHRGAKRVRHAAFDHRSPLSRRRPAEHRHRDLDRHKLGLRPPRRLPKPRRTRPGRLSPIQLSARRDWLDLESQSLDALDPHRVTDPVGARAVTTSADAPISRSTPTVLRRRRV